MKFIAAVCALSAILICVPAPNAAERLKILNSSGSEIINIQAAPKDGEKFFIRLDLSPGASAEVENPGGEAALRVDTGLEFWFFAPLKLAGVRELDFSGDPLRLLALGAGEERLRLDGRKESLTPEPGDKPVCALESFKPMTPMKDVCRLLPADAPEDDNGSLLAGLGFGGMVWAARLAPARDGSGELCLERLELRRPFAEKDLRKLLAHLQKRGYALWQAEFPGQDLDFTPGETARDQERLNDALTKFLSARPKIPRANPTDDEPEASVMLAPANLLPALDDGDAPSTDAQLFTITLRPETGVLRVDVTAYKGGS